MRLKENNRVRTGIVLALITLIMTVGLVIVRSKNTKLSYIYAESYLHDDVLVLPVLTTVYHNGSFQTCRFACKDTEQLNSILEDGVKNADLSKNWVLKVDAEGKQTLIAEEETSEVQMDLSAYGEGSYVIRKYRDKELIATYYIIYQDGEAFLTGDYKDIM